MKHYTQIDNINLQITCDDKEEQKMHKDALLTLIEENELLKPVYPDYNKNERDIIIRNKRNTIATIRTAAFYAGKDMNGEPIVKFYVSIRFKGLASYVKRLEKLSNDLLWKIAAFMKTRDIRCTVTALDICLDVECLFNQMLVICTIPYKRTEYYKLTEKQIYITSTYIEKISKKKLKRSALWSYYYYKTSKDKLDFPLTRYELKLTSKWFNAHGLQMDTIENTLNRYHILVFDSLEVKNSKITEYNKHSIVRDAELDQMKLEDFRVIPDIDYIDHFLRTLFSIDEDLLNVDMDDV